MRHLVIEELVEYRHESFRAGDAFVEDADVALISLRGDAVLRYKSQLGSARWPHFASNE